MILLRFKGPATIGIGCFTVGKIYTGKPDGEHSDAADLSVLLVEDDKGWPWKMSVHNGQFDFPAEVLALVLESVGKLKKGDIVTVNEITDDDMVSVKGFGFYRRNLFIILDHTNVLPRLYVEDRKTKKWVKITRVNESLLIWTEESTEWQSLTDFRFAVSNREILEVPIVQCLDNKGQPELEVGNMYRLVQGNSDSDEVWIEVNNCCKAYSPERFEID